MIEVGFVKIFIEPIYETSYCVIDAYTSATQLNLFSEIELDSLSLRAITSDHVGPLMADFSDMYIFSNANCILSHSEQIKVK